MITVCTKKNSFFIQINKNTNQYDCQKFKFIMIKNNEEIEGR